MWNLIRAIIMVVLTATAGAQDIEKTTSNAPADLRALESSLVGVGMTEEDAVGLVREMVDAQYTDTQMALIGQQIRATAEERNTQNAVISKVREGLAKRAGAEAIRRATDRVRERYEFAMQTGKALTKEHSVNLGVIIADGLSSGLTRQDSEQIVNGLQARSQQMDRDGLYALDVETMTTSRDMVRLGVSSQTTSEVIGAALARGYDAASMQKLRQVINAQRMQSNMNQVAQRLGLAIQQGVKADDLSPHAHAGGREASEGRGFGGFGPGGPGMRGGGAGGGGGRR